MAPVSDPIPHDRVADLISDAEPTRQSAVLHAAWRDYSARAARPYARRGRTYLRPLDTLRRLKKPGSSAI